MDNKSSLKCSKSDLISLVWPPNTCYSTLIEGLPKNVTIDEVKGTWTFRGQTYIIGSRRPDIPEHTGYPINVYDRTKLDHLRQFKSDAEWVRERGRPESFDD